MRHSPGRRPGHIFRKYAVVFGLLVGGALLVSGTVQAYLVYQEKRSALEQVQQAQAAVAATKIAAFLGETQRQIAAAGSPAGGETVFTSGVPEAPWAAAVTAGPPAGGESVFTLEDRRIAYLRLLRQAPAITEVRYLDAAGREQLYLSNLARGVTGSGADFSRDPLFVAARAGGTHVGEVSFRDGSEPAVTIATPAGRGAGAGVTAAEVNLKALWDVVVPIKIGRASYAYVVDGRGQLIAHPDISLVLQHTDLSGLAQVLAAQQGGPAAGEAHNLRGTPVLTAHQTIDPPGWTVFVEQPRAEAFAPLYASLWRTGFLLLAGLALAVLVGVLLARRMVTPVRALQAGAARIGAGDLDQRIEVRTGDELEALAEEFNRMTARLRESYATLESKVDERTHELGEALEQQTATAEVLKVISRSAFDLQPVLDAVVENAVRLCDARAGGLYRFDGEVYRQATTYGVSPEQQAFFADTVPAPGSLVGRVARTGKTVHVPDALADPEMRQLAATRLFGNRARLGVPILREGIPVGVLALARMEPQPFTDKQIELVTTFADQAAIAIENARLFQEIQEKSRQLELADRAKSEFLSRMSHELRTPLNAIIGFAEIMEMDPKTPTRQQDWVRRQLKAGHHLLELINEVLDIARIEAGRLALSPEPVSVADAVQAAAELVRPLAAERDVRLELATTDSGWVRADRQRLGQVLLNLLTNAVKYNRDGGSVTVRCEERPDDRLRLTVRDTGPGIPADRLDRLFVPFERLDADAGVEGTGLGLAIAKHLIEAMNGAIGVESTPGAGSVFWIELPRTAAPAVQLAAEVAWLGPATNGAHAHTGTVLYIEDNSSNLTLMEQALTFRPAVKLVSAMQGTLGLQLARHHRPDLILLDLNLPDLQGDEVLAQLQADETTRDIPVVIVSADATPGQIERLLAAGAHDYLTKPLQVRRLLDLLDAVLEPKGARR